jgi:hypothetical protein
MQRSHRPTEGAGPGAPATDASFHLDRALVNAFVAGTLDSGGEAVLADQVARILPYHWQAPNPIVALLSRIIHRVGGEPELLIWLDAHPGRPRLVARLFALIELLDRFSAEPAVVSAVRELRRRTPYPPGLERHLPPATTRETLASLSTAIELLLADDRPNESVRVAIATALMLQEVAPRAAEINPGARELGELLKPVWHDLLEAVEAEKDLTSDITPVLDAYRAHE